MDKRILTPRAALLSRELRSMNNHFILNGHRGFPRLMTLIDAHGGEGACRNVISRPRTKAWLHHMWLWCQQNAHPDWLLRYSIEGYIISERFRMLFERSENDDWIVPEARQRLWRYLDPGP